MQGMESIKDYSTNKSGKSKRFLLFAILGVGRNLSHVLWVEVIAIWDRIVWPEMPLTQFANIK